LGIPSWRLGPEARDLDHAAEGPRKIRTQLGGPLHHRRSGRQGVIHLGWSGWKPTQEAIELFSLEAILCVNHITSNEKITFCYLKFSYLPRSPCILSATYIGSLAWRLPPREPPERWRLAHIDCSEPAYNGTYPDGHPSEL